MANATDVVESHDAVSAASVPTVDMKFEIVVIPVSDIDQAKAFYARLGWRLDADYDNGSDFRVIQFTPSGSECSVIFGRNVTAATPGSAQGLYLIVSDVGEARENLRRRGIPVSEVFHGAADKYSARTNPTFLVGSGSTVRTPSIAAIDHLPRSATQTATAGCSRRSERGCRGASTPLQRPSHRRAIWRARFGVRRPPTANTRGVSAGNATRIGRNGTPHTWRQSSLAKSYPNKRRTIEEVRCGAAL